MIQAGLPFGAGLQEPGVWQDFLHYARDPDGPPVDAGESDLPDAGRREGNAKRRFRQLSKAVLANGCDAIGKSDYGLRLRNCCTKVYKHVHERGARYVAHECGVPGCPDRERRDARRQAAAIERKVARFMAKHPGSQAVMLTVTNEAVPAHELKDATSAIMKGTSALMRSAPVKRAVLGWVRSIELARHPVSWLWGPHAHYLLIFGPDYFRREKGIYLTQERWALQTQKCMRLSYRPVVDVRVLRGVKAPIDEDGRKSLREISKYKAKPTSLIVARNGKPLLVGSDHSELYDAGDGQGLRPHYNAPLRAFLDATKNRRMLSMSRNLQGNDDLELGEFPEDIEGVQAPADLGRFICTEVYVWRVRGSDADYFLVARTFDEPGRFAMPP